MLLIIVLNIDDDDNSTACSPLSSSQSTSTDGPTSTRVPVIDTSEGAIVEGIVT